MKIVLLISVVVVILTLILTVILLSGLIEKKNRSGFLLICLNIWRSEFRMIGLTLILLFIIYLMFFYLRYYSGISDIDLYQSLTAELGGFFLDVLLLAIILELFRISRDKRNRIDDLHDTIDDFRNWESDEAKIRILSTIKRLNKLGVTEMNLVSINLSKSSKRVIIYNDTINISKSKVSLAKFNKRKMSDAIFESINGDRVIFDEAILLRANFKYAVLKDSSFANAKLQLANFAGARFIEKCNFRQSNLSNAKFDEAEGSNVDFHNCTVDANFVERFNDWPDATKRMFKGHYFVVRTHYITHDTSSIVTEYQSYKLLDLNKIESNRDRVLIETGSDKMVKL